MAKCDHCGQELPTSPALTLRQRIEALKSENYGKGAKGFIDKMVDILLELESRPTIVISPSVGLGTAPGIPAGPTIPPYNPWPNTPWPNTGDPVWPQTYPKIICNTCGDGVKSTAAMTSSPVKAEGNGL